MGKESFYQGLAGEANAQRFLAEQGYRIITTNFRSQQGEIDIIAWDIDTLAFVEVKNYSSRSYGTPLTAVGRSKRASIIHAARFYLYKNEIKNTNCRFDVVTLFRQPNGLCQCELFKNAFMIN